LMRIGMCRGIRRANFTVNCGCRVGHARRQTPRVHQ
jgi:hypothetical protein